MLVVKLQQLKHLRKLSNWFRV